MSVTRAIRKEIKCLEARRGKDASGLMAKAACELGFEAREAAKEQTGRGGKTVGACGAHKGKTRAPQQVLKTSGPLVFLTLTLSLPLPGSQLDMSTLP